MRGEGTAVCDPTDELLQGLQQYSTQEIVRERNKTTPEKKR